MLAVPPAYQSVGGVFPLRWGTPSREGDSKIAFTWGMARMGTIAFSCATLGFVLSARFKAFALVPASLLALGPTLVFGFVNGWGTLGLVLATMANLMILQASYCGTGEFC
jgi:hypothetical protein